MTKVTCGGFKLDENFLGMNENDELSLSGGGSEGKAHQQLVTDGEGKVKWEDTITYFITSGSAIRTGDNWYTGKTATVDDIISAYKKGHTRIIDGPALGKIVGDVVGTYVDRDSGAHKVTYLHKGVLVNL